MQSQTGTLLGATQFRALLKENGFVYRRPKHDLTDLQDPQARETAEEWLEELKKAPKQARSTNPEITSLSGIIWRGKYTLVITCALPRTLIEL